MDSLSNRVAIPFPSPLVGINPGAAPPTLNITTSPAVANALLLAGHPFLFRRKTLASSSCLTLSHVEAELTGPIVGARYSCSAQVHTIDNNSGTVTYKSSSLWAPCAGVLRSLRSPTSAAYAVVNLESTGSSYEGEYKRAEPDDRCLVPLRGIGEAVGALHESAHAMTSGQHRAANAMLRLGTRAAADGNAYPLHYDKAHNLLMQLQGTKTLSLAPPTQMDNAYVRCKKLHARNDKTGACGKEGDGGRHSPVDWNEMRRRVRDAAAAVAAGDEISSSPAAAVGGGPHPKAAKVRGLRLIMREGDALFIPRGWLHAVDRNEPPKHACSLRGKRPWRKRKLQRWPLPWVSLNLFFHHRIRPTFPVFDSCDQQRVWAVEAKMPIAHSRALAAMGVWDAQREYCQTS